MPNPRLASRYAKALIDLAIERGQLEEVFADMKWLQSVCKSNRDFVNVLRSPVIKADVKKKIVEAVTTGRINESFLPEISNAFIEAYKEEKNIHTVRLTTAMPVSEATKEAIVAQIKKTAGYQHIELEEKVNADLIGGFVLQIGDKLVDASIAYDLRAIAKQFESNEFIYKIR